MPLQLSHFGEMPLQKHKLKICHSNFSIVHALRGIEKLEWPISNLCFYNGIFSKCESYSGMDPINPIFYRGSRCFEFLKTGSGARDLNGRTLKLPYRASLIRTGSWHFFWTETSQYTVHAIEQCIVIARLLCLATCSVRRPNHARHHRQISYRRSGPTPPDVVPNSPIAEPRWFHTPSYHAHKSVRPRSVS
jgi:hypothetical protein